MVTVVVSTFEGDRGLTLVTGAFPAVVTAVVIGQRLSRCVPRLSCVTEHWLTLVTGAFPAVVTPAVVTLVYRCVQLW